MNLPRSVNRGLGLGLGVIGRLLKGGPEFVWRAGKE
jgi:hypothetical protein